MQQQQQADWHGAHGGGDGGVILRNHCEEMFQRALTAARAMDDGRDEG